MSRIYKVKMALVWLRSHYKQMYRYLAIYNGIEKQILFKRTVQQTDCLHNTV